MLIHSSSHTCVSVDLSNIPTIWYSGQGRGCDNLIYEGNKQLTTFKTARFSSKINYLHNEYLLPTHEGRMYTISCVGGFRGYLAGLSTSHENTCQECSKKLLRIQYFVLHRSLHYQQQRMCS